MSDMSCTVLFLCTGNSARSIMAEALLHMLGGDRFRAFSAGSHPAGTVQPMALERARAAGCDAALSSKSWDVFAGPGAPRIDIVVTVCDNAAGETCPVWPGAPVRAHWSIPDPATATGSEAARRDAFARAWTQLRDGIEQLVALPVESLDRETLQSRLDAIHPEEPAHAD